MLFHDELLLDLVHVPFAVPDQVLPVAALVDAMTAGRARMPVAARGLGHSLHEGIYEAEFARDALVMAGLVAEALPETTAITVRRLAEVQGLVDRTEGGRFSDREEPGRIPHEIRDASDPIAQEYAERFGWQWPYFGSVDATPLFISAAVREVTRNPAFGAERVTQHDGVERTIVQCVESAVAWLVGRLAASEHCLLESTAASNDCWQVWADSPDAYHHADGRLARGSVAAIEVQGFAYDALIDAAAACESGLVTSDAVQLRIRAERIRRSVFDLAWVEDGDRRFFANGIEVFEGDATPLAVCAANMGLLLETRLLDGELLRPYVEQIVACLFDSELLMSPHGIRTLAANEVRFRPYGYHTGTVWPWQNFVIANGLRRHGYATEAERIERVMQSVCAEVGCTPEYVQGNDTDDVQMNDALMLVETLDGNGGTFTHHAMSPAQKQQGWTAFGLLAVELRSESAQANVA